MFPNHMSLVLRCQKVATTARGAAYLESENLSVYDAATSYFLALAGFYSFRWRPGRLYLGECLTIIRTLGLHKSRDQDYHQTAGNFTSISAHVKDNDAPQFDNITTEIGRRIFWTVFVNLKSMQQLGAASGEHVIPPPTSTDPYPPLPHEVDDFCIYPKHTERQPLGLVPSITGFNANVRVYCSYNALATMELAWGIDAVVDWERQKKVLYESLRRCKDSIDQLPPGLTVDGNSSRPGPTHYPGPTNYPHMGMSKDPAASLMNATLQADNQQDPAQRRSMQREIQKANIYASALSTRSYIVEKYWNLCEAHERARSPKPSSPGSGVTATGLDGLMSHQPTSNPNMVEQEMRQERDGIVRDLLVVLGNIDVVNMEPNADSFVSVLNSCHNSVLLTRYRP